MRKSVRMALDIGGVIGPSLAKRKKPDGSWGLEPGPLSDAFEAIAKLVKKFGAENCYIISHVGDDARVEANWAWLRHWGFFEQTGFLEANVIIYIGERADKAQHVRVHNINVMVDDRFEILASMDEGVTLIAFNSDPEEQRLYALQMRMRVVHMMTRWKQFEAHFGL